MFLIKLNFNQLVDDLDICVSDEENFSGCSGVYGTNLDFGYVLFDTEILLSFVNDIARCGECGESVKTFHEPSQKQGFAHYFTISCTRETCNGKRTVCTSKTIRKTDANHQIKSGRPAFDVNVRSVVAFQELGKGHTAMTKFCGFMNIPNALDRKLIMTVLRL